MRSEGHSIFLSKNEAWTLLAFAGDSANYSKIHFRIGGGGKLDVGSSDGKRSVHCRGKAEKASVKGKWALPCDLLERARSSIQEATESLRIEMTGPNGKPVIYLINTETGDEITHIEWPTGAEEDTQLSLDEIIDAIQVPTDRNYRGSWGAFDPDAFKPLQRLKVTVDGQPVTCYPPATESQPFVFEVQHETGTWTASICTEKVIGPGGEREARPEEDEGAPGDDANARQARMDLTDRANGKGDGDDAPLATEKPRRERKVKPSEMKAPAE